MFDINECDNEMNATITAFSIDLKNIRTGRVSPEILKNIIIDSYGSKMGTRPLLFASCPMARASSGSSRFTVRRLPVSPWCAVAASAGQSFTICVAGPVRPPALPKKQQTARRLPPDGCDRQGRSPRRQP